MQAIVGSEGILSRTSLLDASRNAHLHRSRPVKGIRRDAAGHEVTLTPPPELQQLVNEYLATQAQTKALTTAKPAPTTPVAQSVDTAPAQHTDDNRAYLIFQQLIDENAGVLREIYRRLGALFDPQF